MCKGERITLERDRTSFSVDRSDGKAGSLDGEASSHHLVREPATLGVIISDGQGRLRLPLSMRRSSQAKSGDGWAALSDLDIGDNAITARLNLGLFSNWKVRIDRGTGEIRLRGMDDFEGACEKTQRPIMERKF